MHNFTLDYVKNIQYPVFIFNIVNKLQIYIINKNDIRHFSQRRDKIKQI